MQGWLSQELGFIPTGTSPATRALGSALDKATATPQATPQPSEQPIPHLRHRGDAPMSQQDKAGRCCSLCPSHG